MTRYPKRGFAREKKNEPGWEGSGDARPPQALLAPSLSGSKKRVATVRDLVEWYEPNDLVTCQTDARSIGPFSFWAGVTRFSCCSAFSLLSLSSSTPPFPPLSPSPPLTSRGPPQIRTLSSPSPSLLLLFHSFNTRPPHPPPRYGDSFPRCRRKLKGAFASLARPRQPPSETDGIRCPHGESLERGDEGFGDACLSLSLPSTWIRSPTALLEVLLARGDASAPATNKERFEERERAAPSSEEVSSRSSADIVPDIRTLALLLASIRTTPRGLPTGVTTNIRSHTYVRLSLSLPLSPRGVFAQNDSRGKQLGDHGSSSPDHPRQGDRRRGQDSQRRGESLFCSLDRKSETRQC